MNQQIQLDVGGDVTFDCPQGQATGTPTATVFDSSGTSVGTHSVTNDTVDTTINDTEAAGSTALTLTSTTNVTAGRRYLIDNGTNEPEWVHVKSVDSATVVTLHEPIAYGYAATDTFQGTRLTVAITAGQADALEEGNEVRWVYAVGGVTFRPISQYDIARVLWPPEGQIVATWELKRYAPGMADDEAEGDDGAGLDYREALIVADEDVRRDVVSRGYFVNRFRSHDEFKNPIMERVLYNWAVQGVHIPSVWQDDPREWVDLRRIAYSDSLTDALNTARSYDADETGVLSGSEKAAKLGYARMSR